MFERCDWVGSVGFPTWLSFFSRYYSGSKTDNEIAPDWTLTLEVQGGLEIPLNNFSFLGEWVSKGKLLRVFWPGFDIEVGQKKQKRNRPAEN